MARGEALTSVQAVQKILAILNRVDEKEQICVVESVAAALGRCVEPSPLLLLPK